ncbi:O-antigen ligase [Pontiellaceae bacterium B12227]|nr:O-antigen ligase [Pontiellaceae bacterium B12227]
MTSILLILITICSFIFYGVAGQDKVWLLGPAFILAYAAISAGLISRAWGLSKSIGGGADLQQRVARKTALPPSSWLWVVFLLWGIAMIPLALIPFDATFRVLFVGAVIGSYFLWGQELRAFKDNRTILGWLIFIVMLLALYGLVVHFKCPDRVLWAERYASYEGRLMSTYICPNHFAHLMLMLLPFCLALLFIPESGIYLKVLAGYSALVFLPPLFLTESRAAWLGSIAAVGIVICLMALRRSRKLFGILVVLIPLCSALLLFGAWRFSETVQRRAAPVLEFLQGQAEEGIGSESRDFRPQTWLDTLDMIRESPVTGYGPGSYRYAYPEHRKRFRGHRIVTGHPHNEYLELTADYGLVGFGVFALAWLAGVIWIMVKSLRAEETRHAFMGFAFMGTVGGTMVHSFFDFEMHVFPNAMVFALLAALSAGPLISGKRRKGARGKMADEKEKEVRSEFGGTGFDRRDRRPRPTERLPHSAEDAVSAQSDKRSGNLKKPAIVFRSVFAWILSILFLLLLLVSIRTMLSDYFRVLGDKASLENKRTATRAAGDRFYQLSVQLDAQNWRTYRALGRHLHHDRRHSLDPQEKVEFAEQERVWFEKAVEFNPKDPESLSALGRTLLFLSRSVPAASGSDLADSELRTRSSMLQDRGLQLLQEACQYRKFNDQYWWFWGVELRKAGKFEQALEVFRQMETIRRSQSTRKNIQWLEKQLAEPEADPEPDHQEKQPAAGSKALDIIREMGEDGVRPTESLDDLFRIMESK